ncbi:hypothetical protein DNX55_23105 [Escherichia coli]|nr:hypothetical protein [Salmonella enterica subsp. enterica serovar Agona]EEY5184216.1 hypothetical protein [Escherichia coli]EFX4566197.1 hypothetical protein [Shigella flexneri]EGV4314132.1 hypothetical protein [Salmonella enterica]ECA1997675.1 hypothetical protein [Salmonella enterica subsp. enterica serovar Agona]
MQYGYYNGAHSPQDIFEIEFPVHMFMLFGFIPGIGALFFIHERFRCLITMGYYDYPLFLICNCQ